MKTYKRILVPILSGGQNDILLQRVTELAQASHAQVLVLRVLDINNGIESDGPAGGLPREIAARRAPDELKRIALQLARSNMSWVEAKVVWGEPNSVLGSAIRDWSPDLVVTCSGQLPPEITHNADVLNVGCRSWFKRLAQSWQAPLPRPA